MSVNIASMNIQPAQPLDLSIYPETRTGLPKAGRYTVKAPDSFPDEAFAPAATSGQLTARVDPVIVGPTNENFPIKFTRVSAKVYETKGGKSTSQLGQYLQAFGVTEQLTGDPQQAIALVRSTAGQTCDVVIDWEARHKPSGFKLVGMRGFPSDGNGGFQPWVEHPDPMIVDGEGNRLRLRANLVVRRFLPKRA